MARMYANIQQLTTSAVAASGAKLFVKLAGTDTDTSAYQYPFGSTTVSNPVVADSAGIMDFWLDEMVTYKLTMKSADEATTYWEVDDYVPDASSRLSFASIGGAVLGQPMFGTPISAYGTGDSAVQGAEADDSITYVNLEGQTITTTLDESALTKKYFNGTLYCNNSADELSIYRRESPLRFPEIALRQTRSPVRDWEGKNILWYGTSIPHQLSAGKSYPYWVGEDLNATVVNWAWSGSGLTYDPAADPDATNSVKSLTMTAVDLAEQLAEHGSSSVYDDSFDAITTPSEMTIDHRVYDAQSSTPADVIICDHNHNDRTRAAGTLDPTEYTISAITKGASTTITLSDATGLAQYDGVILTALSGIDDLKYYAGSISAISGNDITLSIDSSAMSGTFSSGTLTKVDRSTLWGAMDFFAYGAWNGAIRGGKTAGASTLPPIIWCSAPSEYTNGIDEPADTSIRSNADYIYDWVIRRNQDIEDDAIDVPYHSFFDVIEALRVNEKDHAVWFPDNVHPDDQYATRALANHWTQWLSGGAIRTWHPEKILVRGSAPTPVSQDVIIYQDAYGGFGSPQWVEGTASTVKSEDFASIADWTATNGDNTAVVAGDTDDWNSGSNVLDVTVTNGDESQYIELGSLTIDDGIDAEFKLWIPTVTGGVSSGTATCVLLNILTTSTAHYQVQLLVRSSGMTLRAGCLPTTGGSFTYTDQSDALEAETAYTVKIRTIKSDGTFDGALQLFVDGVAVGDPARFDNSTRGADNTIRLGCVSSNATSTFSYEIADFTLQDFSVDAWDIGLKDIYDAASGGGSGFNGTLTNTNLEVINDNTTSGITPQVIINRKRSDYATPGAYNLGRIRFQGYDSAQNTDDAAQFQALWSNNTSGSETGQLVLNMPISGTDTNVMGWKNGVIIGTGLTYQGTGTLNITGGLYVDDSLVISDTIADVSDEYRVGGSKVIDDAEANVSTSYKIGGTTRLSASLANVTTEYQIGGSTALSASIADVSTGYRVGGVSRLTATQVNITAGYLVNGTTRLSATNVNPTSTVQVNSNTRITTTAFLDASGNQVVGAQQPAIGDVMGAVTNSTTGTATAVLVNVGVSYSQTKINDNFSTLHNQIEDLKDIVQDLLDANRAHGLIDT